MAKKNGKKVEAVENVVEKVVENVVDTVEIVVDQTECLRERAISRWIGNDSDKQELVAMAHEYNLPLPEVVESTIQALMETIQGEDKIQQEQLQEALALDPEVLAERERERAKEKMKQAMERLALRIAYPNAIKVTEKLFFDVTKEKEKTGSLLYNYVSESIAPLLLNGQTDGRLFVGDCTTATGMEFDAIKKSCSLCTRKLSDSLATLSCRSGKSFLRISYSSSLKKGIGIAWEVVSFA